ncbi:hypothetical protein SCD92_12940, partial [Gilvimarinus sp. SDUM040013]
KFFPKLHPDPQHYPGFTVVDHIKTFLVYKSYGLVGKIQVEPEGYMVNNLCPDVWDDVPGGEMLVQREEFRSKNIFWGLDVYEAVEVCQDLGYKVVTSDDTLTLAAISLQRFAGDIHVLASDAELDDRF